MSAAARDDDDGGGGDLEGREDENENENEDEDEEETETDGWVPGLNLERDISLLRSAVAEGRASVDLAESRRSYQSHYMAECRRAAFPDLARFGTRALGCTAAVLLALYLTAVGGAGATTTTAMASPLGYRLPSTPSATASLALRTLFVASDVHYWSITVSAPILLLLFKNRSLRRPANAPPPTRTRDPNYVDPKSSVSDHSLCSFENWTSSMGGVCPPWLALG